MNYLAVAERFFGDQAGGANRIAWELCRLYRGRGHRVALLCGAGPEDNPRAVETLEGVDIIRFRPRALPSFHPLRWRGQQLAAEDAFRARLSGERWDVVHAHALAPALGVLRALEHAPGGRPRFVATVHSPVVLEQRLNWAGPGWSKRLKRLFGFGMLRRSEATLLRAAQQIHVLSRYSRDMLERLHGGWVLPKIQILPWWMERHDHVEVQRTSAAFRLLTVRRLVPRTGVDLLLRALVPLISFPRFWMLDIVGTGSEEGPLRALSASLGLSERVRFRGRVSEEQLHHAYAAADLFVLPTRDLECFGLIVLEAYAHGLPVVGTTQGAIPEVVKPVFPEGLVPVEDVPALTQRLRQILEGTLLLPALDQIRARAEAHWAFADISERYVSWLER